MRKKKIEKFFSASDMSFYILNMHPQLRSKSAEWTQSARFERKNTLFD